MARPAGTTLRQTPAPVRGSLSCKVVVSVQARRLASTSRCGATRRVGDVVILCEETHTHTEPRVPPSPHPLGHVTRLIQALFKGGQPRLPAPGTCTPLPPDHSPLHTPSRVLAKLSPLTPTSTLPNPGRRCQPADEPLESSVHPVLQPGLHAVGDEGSGVGPFMHGTIRRTLYTKPRPPAHRICGLGSGHQSVQRRLGISSPERCPPKNRSGRLVAQDG
jgi:hypothetical protein